MALEKTPLQTVVSIAHDAAGNVTHAWKVTAFVVTEDGVELSRASSGQENIEPADLAKALPDQAALLAQIGDKDKAAQAAAVTSAAEVAARDATIADLQKQIAEATAAHDQVVQKVANATAALSS